MVPQEVDVLPELLPFLLRNLALPRYSEHPLRSERQSHRFVSGFKKIDQGTCKTFWQNLADFEIFKGHLAAALGEKRREELHADEHAAEIKILSQFW